MMSERSTLSIEARRVLVCARDEAEPKAQEWAAASHRIRVAMQQASLGEGEGGGDSMPKGPRRSRSRWAQLSQPLLLAAGFLMVAGSGWLLVGGEVLGDRGSDSHSHTLSEVTGPAEQRTTRKTAESRVEGVRVAQGFEKSARTQAQDPLEAAPGPGPASGEELLSATVEGRARRVSPQVRDAGPRRDQRASLEGHSLESPSDFRASPLEPGGKTSAPRRYPFDRLGAMHRLTQREPSETQEAASMRHTALSGGRFDAMRGLRTVSRAN